MSINYYTVELEEVIDRIKRVLSRDKRVRVAVLFGSSTRRRLVRDVDVAFYATPPLTLKETLLLGYLVESELGVPVDLIPLNEIPPPLQYDVLTRGVPVIVRDEVLFNKLTAMALGGKQDLELKLNLIAHSRALG